MSWPEATKWFLILNCLVTALWAILVPALFGTDASISRVFKDLVTRHPIVGVLYGGIFIGFVCHALWPN